MTEHLTRATLRGTWAPVLLPLRDDEAIDWDLLEGELDYLLDSGLAGIYTNGTASEFYALTEAEDRQLATLVARRCRDAVVPFQLGAGHMSLVVSRERLRHAVALDPSAVQVILPDWLPLSDAEVLDVVVDLAREAGDVPLVLYNPPHAKTVASPRLLGELARAVPTLVGVKVAGGDPGWFAEIRKEVDDLAVFVAGHRLASGLAQGAAGSYSNIACLSPRLAVRWFEDMHTRPEHAIDVERRINAFFDAHIAPLQRAGYANPALDKALAAVGGWADLGTRTRRPYRYLDPGAVAGLRSAAETFIPELLSA